VIRWSVRENTITGWKDSNLVYIGSAVVGRILVYSELNEGVKLIACFKIKHELINTCTFN
jgi:hypothetical protein